MDCRSAEPLALQCADGLLAATLRTCKIDTIYTETFSPYRAVNSLSYTNQSLLYREIVAVCSQIHTKHINTLCGQNVELVNGKLAVRIVTAGL